MSTQEKEFFEREGNAWFSRNNLDMIENYKGDLFLDYLLTLPLKGKLVLNIGCGIGHRLAQLAEHGAECYGIEPSKMAVDEGNARFPKIRLRQRLWRHHSYRLSYVI